jgi:hypothetical protein
VGVQDVAVHRQYGKAEKAAAAERCSVDVRWPSCSAATLSERMQPQATQPHYVIMMWYVYEKNNVRHKRVGHPSESAT